MYSPVFDEQRYCGACSRWFHATCLGEPEGERDTLGPLGYRLKTSPIVRGWNGVDKDLAKDWMTVGTYKRVETVKRNYDNNLNQNWEDVLGIDFINYSTTTPSLLSQYSCPDCKQII